MKMKSQHINVVKMLAYSSAPKREIARIANISEQTLYNWLKDPDFARIHEMYEQRYKLAVEEYQATSNYEKFLSDLEISRDDKHIIANLAYVDTNAPALIDKQRTRIDNLFEQCLTLVEKRIEENNAEDELIIYLLEKYFNKMVN